MGSGWKQDPDLARKIDNEFFDEYQFESVSASVCADFVSSRSSADFLKHAISELKDLKYMKDLRENPN